MQISKSANVPPITSEGYFLGEKPPETIPYRRTPAPLAPAAPRPLPLKAPLIPTAVRPGNPLQNIKH